jgi:hypothetical protein
MYCRFLNLNTKIDLYRKEKLLQPLFVVVKPVCKVPTCYVIGHSILVYVIYSLAVMSEDAVKERFQFQ